MNGAPRTAELFLEALCTETAFRDDLVGDFAEELSQRAGRDGARAARRWYYRELLRTTPHVAASWLSRLTAREARRLIAIGFSALTFLIVLDVLALLLAKGLAWQFGLVHSVSAFRLHGVGWNVAILTFATLNACLGGFIAAAVGDRTPLLSGFALGVVWTSVDLLVRGVMLLSTAALHPWLSMAFGVLVGVVMVGLTIAGAMIRIRTSGQSLPRAALGT